MNPNFKFHRRALGLALFQQFTLAVCLIVWTAFSAGFAHGQGGFQPPGGFQPANPEPSSNQWQEPAEAFNAQPANSQNQLGGEQSAPRFPTDPVAFAPGVRTAELDVPPSKNPGSIDTSVESTLESTAAVISNLKEATNEKLSGLMTSLNQEGSWTDKLKSISASTDIGKMLGSLALVLGLYFAFVWAMRKINPSSNRGIPPEVIDVLGQIPFGPRRNLQLVRLGSKLLLLLNSAEGTQSLGEITNPSEVEYLTSLCEGKFKKRQKRLAQNGANVAPVPQSITQSTAAPIQPANNSNLASILRTLEQAAQPQPDNALFEA
ncbi:MAG: flagellar biogenesis protein FliO [Mariniblastus sp.]|jgi:flagellar biogenesis protein FliO